MKRRVRPEIILYGIIISALLFGAMLGALITLGVVSAKEEPSNVVDFETIVKELPEEEKEETPDQLSKPVEEKKEIKSVGMCEVTAYCTCVKCCGIWSKDHPSRQGTGYVQKTATGTIPTAGRTVSVDPTIIPLGSEVIIDGVSYVAEDTGKLVKGKIVDIYFSDHDEAVKFGRQVADVAYID